MTGWAPRLNTQTLSCLSTATPELSPKFQPFGSFAQSFTSLCGNGGPLFKPLLKAFVENRASNAANAHTIDCLAFTAILLSLSLITQHSVLSTLPNHFFPTSPSFSSSALTSVCSVLILPQYLSSASTIVQG